MNKVRGFLQTTRFVKSLGVALIISTLANDALYGTGALIFLLFSFVYNDYIDAEKDAVGHPDRAIPSGKLTHFDAAIMSCALLSVGVLYTYLALPDYVQIIGSAYMLSILYSFLLKPRIPALATLAWSTAVALVFMPPFAQSPLAYIAMGSIVYGYEVLLDYRDRIADDLFCSTPTIANILGKKSFILAAAAIIFGVILLTRELF